MCCSQRGRGICCLIFEDAYASQCGEDAGVLTGRKVDVASYSSFVSYFQAVEHQHKDCVAILLEHGANPNLRDVSGNTALHLAAIIASKPLVELLLEHNADIEAPNVVSLDFG